MNSSAVLVLSGAVAWFAITLELDVAQYVAFVKSSLYKAKFVGAIVTNPVVG